ncbi:MAG: hypothetical protein U0992_04705 [Planctomycetaceae bacterium]
MPILAGARRRRLCLVLCGLALVCAAAAIEVAAQSAVPTEDALTLDSQPPRLLILFDGRVLEGNVSEVPGGYRIDGGSGSEVIPFNLVRLAASSLDDAYVKQRDALHKPNASDHLALAQWCYEYKLYAHATEQLTASLKLEPNRIEAVDLLKKIAEISPEQVGGNLKLLAEQGAQHKTSSGLTPAAQAEFVRRVQPILVNRCGDARCHGSAANNNLKLINIRAGRRQQRLETETNLAAVLKMVDPQSPNQSPLLRAPQDGSAAHRNAFFGQAGATQLERIRAWVTQIAPELPSSSSGERLWGDEPASGVKHAAFSSKPTGSTQSGVQTTAHEVEIESPLLLEIPISPRPIGATAMAPAAVEAATTPVADRTMAPPTPGQSPQPAQSSLPKPAENRTQFLRDILEQNRPDEFDPNEFNRQVHKGRASQ